MAAPKKKLIVIESGLIAAMARDARFLKEFQFLGSIAKAVPKKRGCGTCGRAAGETAALYASAKRMIGGMDSDKKRKLKDMLNAEKARVTYVNPSTKKVTELTF